MSIPQSFIQELLGRVDVVEVVGRHVQLKKSGANYMGLCPFHGEKSPSFSVSPSKQFYHCFGCGKNGNAIGFLMEHAGMGFVEAVQDLAQGAGLAVPDERASPAERARAAEQRRQLATITDVLEQAGKAWRAQLRKAPRAIAYFKGRGVSGQIAKRYGLGYAPEGWRGLASVFPEYDSPLLEQAGLVIVGEDDGKRYDRFRDRVMFPIRNVKGECIGFGGRVLGDDKPKYLNSPETPVFHKGHELYGLYEARTAMRAMGYALVTEGYMDVIALAQHGFANAVATLGTACTPEHVHKLFRFTDTVVFGFDGDAAGRRAARKALEGALPYASDTRTVKFLFLPPEHDPDSFVREHGEDGFSRAVEGALPLSRFLLQAAREDCDLTSAEGRAHMLSNARGLWEALPDGALKRQLLGELAQQGQLPVADLTALWAQAGGDAAAPAQPGPAPAPGRQRRPWQKGERSGRWSAPAQPPRPQPARRIDHAARLLLSHMQFLEALSHEELAMLREQPPPHGRLMLWLEAQLHEHGPQPWAVLREALAGQDCQALAERLMTGSHAQTEGEEAELRWELRDLMGRMLAEAIAHEQKALIAQAAHEPETLERYRQLEKRRLELLQPQRRQP
ncbi:DNA primase [Oryzisolibacter propanilivorax]|uniref:DNA primase n=1 Tax=Oryzisolibacter propanilivorax TaxID=1527607 RepID=A0A1G9UJS2_9BURK|nr:DNA primase [Oryzisolibacter propanilivorax]SDM60127.1 DNA primase [Oryzisolibacter propanilivorax]